MDWLSQMCVQISDGSPKKKGSCTGLHQAGSITDHSAKKKTNPNNIQFLYKIMITQLRRAICMPHTLKGSSSSRTFLFNPFSVIAMS